MDKNSKISIITPSFNCGHHIERAIQSVLSQDYDNWEHIIVDGGSTDDTLDILKKYDHLKWVSETDKGQSDAMNKGFNMSEGDIIGYLNADDWYETFVFQMIVTCFELQNIEMVVGDVKVQYENGDFEIRSPSGKYSHIIQYWVNKFPPNPVGYFYKRSVQEDYGLFPIHNHMTMDLDFIFFVYRFFSVTYIPEIFGIFYLDGNNKTANMDVLAEQKKVFSKFLKRYDYPRFLYFYYPQVNLFVYKIKKKVKKWLTKEQ